MQDDYIERTLSPNTEEFVSIQTVHNSNEEPEVPIHCFNAEKDVKVLNDLSSTSCVFMQENKKFNSFHLQEDNRVKDNVVDIICERMETKDRTELIPPTYRSFNVRINPKKIESFKEQDVLYSIVGNLNSSLTTAELKKDEKGKISSSTNDCVSESKVKIDVEPHKELSNIEHLEANERRKEHNTFTDEFDVEAQIKKITGDEGDDSFILQKSIDKSFEKVDGIKDLIESSKEDSDSEKDEKDYEKSEKNKFICASQDVTEDYKEIINIHEQSLKDTTSVLDKPVKLIQQPEKFINKAQISIKNCSQNDPRHRFKLTLCNFEEVFTAYSEESTKKISNKISAQKCDKNSMEYFSAIPPLSERIKKRTDSTLNLKSKMEIEASKIESSIDFELNKIDTNYKDKKLVSSALSDFSKSKILQDQKFINEMKRQNELEKQKSPSPTFHQEKKKITGGQSSCQNEFLPAGDSSESFTEKNIISDVESKIKPHSNTDFFSLEPQKLKDPRTAVPNKLVQIQLTQKSLPAKRKV